MDKKKINKIIKNNKSLKGKAKKKKKINKIIKNNKSLKGKTKKKRKLLKKKVKRKRKPLKKKVKKKKKINVITDIKNKQLVKIIINNLLKEEKKKRKPRKRKKKKKDEKKDEIVDLSSIAKVNILLRDLRNESRNEYQNKLLQVIKDDKQQIQDLNRARLQDERSFESFIRQLNQRLQKERQKGNLPSQKIKESKKSPLLTPIHTTIFSASQEPIEEKEVDIIGDEDIMSDEEPIIKPLSLQEKAIIGEKLGTDEESIKQQFDFALSQYMGLSKKFLSQIFAKSNLIATDSDLSKPKRHIKIRQLLVDHPNLIRMVNNFHKKKIIAVGGTKEHKKRKDSLLKDSLIAIDIKGEGGGVYGADIEKFMSQYPNFSGVYASDELLKLPNKKKMGFIMNLSPRKSEGSHWVAVYIDVNNDKSLEYFDSFADDPSEEFMKDIKKVLKKINPPTYLKFKINKIKNQSVNSSLCGYHSMLFLIDRFNDIPFKESSGFSKIRKSEKKARKFEKKFKKFKKIKH